MSFITISSLSLFFALATLLFAVFRSTNLSRESRNLAKHIIRRGVLKHSYARASLGYIKMRLFLYGFILNTKPLVQSIIDLGINLWRKLILNLLVDI